MDSRRIDTIGLKGDSHQRRAQKRQLIRQHGKNRVRESFGGRYQVRVYLGDWTNKELSRR